MSRVTLASLEVVSIPGIGLLNVIAKVDTGAYSGAIHCTDIKLVRRGVTRKRILKFVPTGNAELSAETDSFRTKNVRSASGHLTKRYIIDTVINIQGKDYPISIGLSDRTDLRRQVLIGRRFIRENNMLVDVTLRARFDDKGEKLL